MHMSLFTIICILFFVFCLLPFVTGLREFSKKADAEPLKINMDYLRDPRYFAHAFKKILTDSFSPQGAVKGLRLVGLSKQEAVQVVDSATVSGGGVVEDVYYVKGNLESAEKALFEKEIYVGGTATIGEENQLRALACDGDIRIARGTKIIRWIDAEGSLVVGKGCRLGTSASSGQGLAVGSGCSFKRLYGFPVVAGAAAGNLPPTKDAAAVDPIVCECIERDREEVQPYENVNCNIITSHSLTIGDHAVVRGHIKTHGKCTIGAGVTIAGNVFAEEEVQIGPGSRILGNLFSQGQVVCNAEATIGLAGKTKSLIGKKGVVLEEGVRVYGQVLTEGEGRVV